MDYYELGDYSREISSTSGGAHQWFNRGLVWTYAYNHEEAISCFQQAINADPDCALAYWGIAYAIGPNYNKPWEAFEPEEKPEALQQALDAINKAEEIVQRLAGKLSAVERGLITSIQHRYPNDSELEDYGPYNDAYANSMRELYRSHTEDLDVCSLFAEALMNRTPWQLWNLSDGQPADGADTMEAVTVLESTFDSVDGAWEHPGLLHMYIHLMEMSPFPERALRQGDRLATLVPDAGHLVHMGTHVDVLCGDYAKVVSQNHLAIEADRKYLQREGAENFYSVYRCHDYHFKIYGAMFLGQLTPAMSAANELIDTLPREILSPLADWFEGFIPMKQHVLIRFGQWQSILEQNLPDDKVLYSVTTAMMRYARAIALANTGKISAAEQEATLFAEAFDAVPESRMLFNNTCRDILQVAREMMNGEVEYHKGNHSAAFDYLRNAVTLDDNLPYDEPWGWMQPARHALGALLLDQGEYREAEAVYRADLGLDATLSRACQHPGNVWSLHGLHECLINRDELVESLHVKLQLDKALARSEVEIKASCYCRVMSA